MSGAGQEQLWHGRTTDQTMYQHEYAKPACNVTVTDAYRSNATANAATKPPDSKQHTKHNGNKARQPQWTWSAPYATGTTTVKHKQKQPKHAKPTPRTYPRSHTHARPTQHSDRPRPTTPSTPSVLAGRCCGKSPVRPWGICPCARRAAVMGRRFGRPLRLERPAFLRLLRSAQA